jgi:hypothetical protein
MATYRKQVPRLPWGLPKLRVQRRNSPVGSEPLRATRARDEAIQGVASSWCIRSPIEGTQHPQASYLSLDREVSFTALHVGWHLAVRVSPPRITRERRLKPPGLDLVGGGGISSGLVLWRGTCPGWLSPMNSDPSSTEIRTQHCSAQFSPFRLSKHLRMGLVRMPHHILITRMEPWGFIKSSTQNKVVHMELSLRLSFYLRHSLGGYMVGTAIGFLVEIMEALAPQPCRRIQRKCPQ